MATPTPKPQIEILHKSTTELPDKEGKLQPYTHIVYRDERGIIGTITIPKKEPSDAEIAIEIRKQREAEKARKPHIITL
jgi:hypothetical protein